MCTVHLKTDIRACMCLHLVLNLKRATIPINILSARILEESQANYK